MVLQKKEHHPKKKSGSGIFFVGIIGLVILVGIFYFSPGSKEKETTKESTQKASSSPGFFSDLFKALENLDPKKNNSGLKVNPPPQGSPIPGQYQGTTPGGYGPLASIPKENLSVWKGKISLSQGNATYEVQSYKEYITIRAGSVGPAGVNITGWKLENGRGERYYQSGGNSVLLTSESALIPGGAKLFIPNGTNYFRPVVLMQNQTATIVTGGILNMGSTPIQGFQVNKCSGYLEQLSDYQFFPPMFSQCPIPRNEIGAYSLENSCYQFIQSLSSCRTPKFPELTRIGNRLEPGYVDNTPGLSNQCKDYLKEHYSYTACVVNHSGDKDFYQNDWRLFLNRPWEMWGKDREVFTLYDADGKIVDRITSGF